MPRYYNLKTKKDIIGHLIIGLAPHTSAGTVGRIIGFTKTQGMFTHPLYHAAMRRNCDGDEACAILLLDALLNFSRSFLPDKRGSRTMDAPLVLTSHLIPGEVDDEVHGMDIVWEYPLEFYEAAVKYKYPWDVDVVQIDNVLNTPKQYEKMGYTHDVSNMNMGVRCSAYKKLPTMQEKLMGQMDLAEKIVAVEPEEVAQLVIEKHFLKDIKGNLRKFSTQQFRCVKCNDKYRRPPLAGKCHSCGGKIIFTISEGSIIKYLEPTLSLARKYDVTPYLKQNLDFLEKQVASVLGKPKEKQEGLGKWLVNYFFSSNTSCT
jgi:DNA polymerase II large subunit